MSVRKTESRFPETLQAADLGQAIVSADGKCALISFIVSPLVIDRENTYVVFITDPVLSGAVNSFAWSIAENNGAATTHSSEYGEFLYRPQAIGQLSLTVKLLDSSDSEQASLTMTQDIVPLNAELENLIIESCNEPGPGIGNIEVARELINDHNPFYQAVTLQSPEEGNGFKRFVYNIASDGALQQTPQQRRIKLNELADSLNNESGDFATIAANLTGICGIRLVLHSMVLPQMLPWTELPENTSQRAAAEERLRQDLAALDENKRIDLFNLVRFPKSNIKQCGRILEALRDRYFNGTNFNDILTGMSGTRAHWITRHYREGPLIH